VLYSIETSPSRSSNQARRERGGLSSQGRCDDGDFGVDGVDGDDIGEFLLASLKRGREEIALNEEIPAYLTKKRK